MRTFSVSRTGVAILVAAFGLAEFGPSHAVRGQSVPTGIQIDRAARAVALSASGQQRRRRSRRPRRRNMTYESITVTNGGTIEGVVLYRGPLPPPRRIEIVKDAEHCSHRPTSVPRINVNDRGHVADAVVFLADIRRGKAIPPAEKNHTIDQKACTFHPHVQAIPLRQTLEVINSDPMLHNIQASQGVRELFNRAQARQNMRFEWTFTRGGLVAVRCQAHAWMQAFIYVLWHPYYQVTGEDGAFTLTDVPPGEYELTVWQEFLGEQSLTIKVEAGRPVPVEFTLNPKSR